MGDATNLDAPRLTPADPPATAMQELPVTVRGTMQTRVMISAATNPDTNVRVDANLGYGFRALPPFEQERRIERVLEDARERLIREVVAR